MERKPIYLEKENVREKEPRGNVCVEEVCPNKEGSTVNYEVHDNTNNPEKYYAYNVNLSEINSGGSISIKSATKSKSDEFILFIVKLLGKSALEFLKIYFKFMLVNMAVLGYLTVSKASPEDVTIVKEFFRTLTGLLIIIKTSIISANIAECISHKLANYSANIPIFFARPKWLKKLYREYNIPYKKGEVDELK